MTYVKTFENFSENSNGLIQMLTAMSRFGSGIQQELAKKKLDSLKAVSCVPLTEAVGEDAAKKTIERVKIAKKECYANALHTAECLRSLDVKYCEGWMMLYGIPIEHAFNKVGDTYFDVTAEIALGDDVTKTEYYVIGEWDPDTALQIMASGDQCYGEVFNKQFFKSHTEKIK